MSRQFISALVDKSIEDPVSGLLEPRLEADPLLRAIDQLAFRFAGARLRLTRIDKAACMVARALVGRRVDAAAIAFPRGHGPQAGMLGLFLALYRYCSPMLSGSVAVSTRRMEVSDAVRDLTFDAAAFERFEVARLVSEAVGGPGDAIPRRRPARKLLPGGRRRGISQDDGLLLFCRPNTVPPLARNVIWAMVVDTVGCSHPSPFHGDAESDSWSRTWNSNVADERAQVWVGELGDEAFESFCSGHGIPMVRFDWPLLSMLVRDERTAASGSLAAGALRARALERRPVGLRLVTAPEHERDLREAWSLVFKLQKRCGDASPPVLNTVRSLLGILGRLIVPLEDYDRASARDPFARPIAKMVVALEMVTSSTFTGKKAKAAYRGYWDPLMGVIRRLLRHAAEDDGGPKFEAVFERIALAQHDEERVRVMCQTRVEKFAIQDKIEEFELDGAASCATMSDRLPYGTARAGMTTLLLGPPPPWRIGLLTSGEEGKTEVLCYGHERARLVARVDEAEVDHTATNLEALAELGFDRRVPSDGDGESLGELEVLPPLSAPGEAEAQEVEELSLEDPMWAKLVTLYGQELRDEADTGADEEPGVVDLRPYSGTACLLRFSDAPPAFFRDDAPVDVLADEDEAVTLQLLPKDLRPGMVVAFLPGGGRSVLDELLSMYDVQLDVEQRMFLPLWRQAIRTATDKVGVDGLADALGRSKFAVWDWLAGRTTPREEWRFKQILEISGCEEAIRAQTPIWTFLSTLRGQHRRIGRLNNLAIAEALRDDPNPTHLRELERKIGHRLNDIYDHIEQVTVTSVSEPVAVPLAACGRPLSNNDPLITI